MRQKSLLMIPDQTGYLRHGCTMGLQNSLTIESDQRTTWQLKFSVDELRIVQTRINNSKLKYTVMESKLPFGKKHWFIIIV